MNKTYPNEPAFPVHIETLPHNMGLTKREYFAAMAMQGVLSAPHLVPNSEGVEYAVKISLIAADALIQQLNEPIPNPKQGGE